jgi:hypothetical protein
MPDDQLNMPAAAKRILGGKGAKLHTHEMHLRRTANKGFIAKHDLRDKHGNSPQDGQKGEAEYSLADKAAMLAHVGQHMDEPEEEEEEQEQ